MKLIKCSIEAYSSIGPEPDVDGLVGALRHALDTEVEHTVTAGEHGDGFSSTRVTFTLGDVEVYCWP